MLEVVAEENAEAMQYVDLLMAHPVDGQEATQPQSQLQQDPTPKMGTAKQQVSPLVLIPFAKCPEYEAECEMLGSLPGIHALHLD